MIYNTKHSGKVQNRCSAIYIARCTIAPIARSCAAALGLHARSCAAALGLHTNCTIALINVTNYEPINF